jgi:hypothetical protein
MKKARQGLGWITTILLVSGYLASQYATVAGTSQDYSAKVDQSPIILLSLILFLGSIFLFLSPTGSEDNP